MKRKVNINRPPISSEEIAKTKDFAGLSKLANPANLPFYKSSWFAPTIAGISLVVALVAFEYISSKEETTNLATNQAEISKVIPTEIIKTKYDEDTPCINPPSDHLTINSSSYMVENSKGGVFTHPSGTTIEIPKNAFEKDGQSVQGEVEIQYKEFKDQIDILLSGIPMHYDSAGSNFVLESAGMVQIYGFQNNIPIDIKKGKAIKISFPTEDRSTRFNLYQLDTLANKWDYKGKPNLDVSENKIANEPFEVEDIAIISDSNDYCFISTSTFEKEKDQLSNALQLVKEDIADLKANKPVVVNESKNKDRQFNLDIDKNEFPELSEFSEVVFEVLEEDENFHPEVYDVEWKNVLLKEKIPGEIYFLNLFGTSNELTLLVRPILNEKDQEKAKQLFTDYSNKLTQKIEEEIQLQKRLEEAKKRHQEEIKKMEDQRLLQERKFQHQARQRKFKEVVVRSFEVTNFGSWNCDSPVKQPKGKTIDASFASLAGTPIVLASVYLIEKDKNAIFTYVESQFDNLKFNPKETNTLIGFTLDDQIAIFKPEQFSSVNQKKHEFKMELKKAVDLSVDKLKKIILAR
tara:strand:- start:85 stop:1812 length:1728 start_codon:yes stop_codon:yes gene_type:complete